MLSIFEVTEIASIDQPVFEYFDTGVFFWFYVVFDEGTAKLCRHKQLEKSHAIVVLIAIPSRSDWFCFEPILFLRLLALNSFW